MPLPPAHTTATNVWSGYKAVWHLDNLSDSTANGYTLTNYNSGTALNTDGKLGSCYTIAPSTATRGGTHGLVALGTTNATLGTAFTVSGWLRHHGATSWDHVFYRKNTASETGGFSSECNNAEKTKLNVYGSGRGNTPVTLPTNEDTWVYVALAYNGTSLKGYTNGFLSASSTGITAPTDNGRPLSVGNNWNPTTQVPSDSFWMGEMDELRVYSTNASAGWMAAEYATQANAAFLTYGTKESNDQTTAVITAAPTLSRAEDGTVTLAATVAGTAGSTYRIFAVYNNAITNEIAAAWTPTAGNLTNSVLSAATVATGPTYAVSLYG